MIRHHLNGNQSVVLPVAGFDMALHEQYLLPAQKSLAKTKGNKVVRTFHLEVWKISFMESKFQPVSDLGFVRFSLRFQYDRHSCLSPLLFCVTDKNVCRTANSNPGSSAPTRLQVGSSNLETRLDEKVVLLVGIYNPPHWLEE